MSPLIFPAAPALLTRKAWTAFLVCLLVVGVLAPVLNLWVPAGNALHMSDYAIALVGKIMCYASARWPWT